MPLLHGTNTWNVESTIERHFRDELATIQLPPFLPSYSVVQNEPETNIETPSFSFHHIPAGIRPLWMGDKVGDNESGMKSLAIFEISAWVSRGKSTHWNKQLKYLHSMVEHVFKNTRTGIQVRDFASSTTNPVHLPYLIRFIELEIVQTLPDENTDIERRRILIAYNWVNRAS